MFDKTARFYDAIYAFKDYAAEADRLDELIRGRKRDAASLLDVACGTGKHVENLRDRYPDIAGIDLDPVLLEIARERNPGVPFEEADFTDFDLGRTFDAVTCLFSAIGYARTTDKLNAAVACMARHLNPGGVLVFDRWIMPEQWVTEGISALFVDEPDLKIARMNTKTKQGSLSILDFSYLVGTPEGISHFTERHELGLFSDEDYRDALGYAGLEIEFDAEGLMVLTRPGGQHRGAYIGVKPATLPT